METYDNCLCSHTLFVDDKSISKYQIHNRLDVVHKLLSKIDFRTCTNIDKCITDIVISVQNNLRKIERSIIPKGLSEIPKSDWTILFEYYMRNTSDPAVWVDYHKGLIHYDSAGRFTSDRTIYLHSGEKEPEPIYNVVFKNQAYCILCDADSTCSRIRNIKINNQQFSIENMEKNKPYICQRVCDKLVINYATAVVDKLGTYDITNSYKKLRHVANRAVQLYCGNSYDSGSIFSLVPKDIIKCILVAYLYTLQ